MKRCAICKKRILIKKKIKHPPVTISNFCRKCYNKHKNILIKTTDEVLDILPDIYFNELLYGECLFKIDENGNIEVLDPE